MKNFLISLKITLSFCVILFVGYVMILWGVATFTQPNGGRAEVLTRNSQIVGVSNVGQTFTQPDYFWSRPSNVDYDGAGSGGSNKGNTNPEYLVEISTRIDNFLAAHPYLNRSEVPSEMITASASGLDPHISVTSAMVQARRVAEARGTSVENITKIIEKTQENPLIGPPFINVLKLNIVLDEAFHN